MSSAVQELIPHYRAVRARLRNPPNAFVCKPPALEVVAPPAPPTPEMVVAADQAVAMSPVAQELMRDLDRIERRLEKLREQALSGVVLTIAIKDIIKATAAEMGVSVNEIMSTRRQRSIVIARHVGMYVAKTITNRSLPEIGRRFGGRDHTTVLHAVRTMERRMIENPELGEKVRKLIAQLSV